MRCGECWKDYIACGARGRRFESGLPEFCREVAQSVEHEKNVFSILSPFHFSPAANAARNYINTQVAGSSPVVSPIRRDVAQSDRAAYQRFDNNSSLFSSDIEH